MRSIAWLLLAVVASGCDSKKSSPTAAGSGSGPGGGSAAAAAPADAAASAAIAIDAPPPPGGVPELALGDPDEATIVASGKLNNDGFALHGKKQFPEAIAKYREALTTDAGNLLARYNLASALVSTGDTATGLTLLAQFKRPDCRACSGILLHAAKDSEWKAVHADPAFKAIVDGITADKLPMKKVFKAVIAALRTGKTEGLEPYVHPRTPIVISEAQNSPEGPPKPVKVYGWKGFTTWLKPDKNLSEPNDDEYTECDAKCCNFGQRGDSSDVVDHVCFAGAGGVLFISAIELDFGAI